MGLRAPAWLLRGLPSLGFALLAARALDIYIEFGLGLIGITTIAADQRDEYLPLARWFLFLWLPWFALGAVAWGALASRSPRRRTGRIMPSDDSPMVSMVRMGSPVRFQWCSARRYR